MNKFILVTSPAQTVPAFFTRDIDGTINTDGFSEAIVEADGSQGQTKLYIKALVPNFATGKMIVEKRQMNANLSDDVSISTIEIPFSTFNDAVNNAVLVHDWGKSENPVSFKLKVTTAFTGGTDPTVLKPRYIWNGNVSLPVDEAGMPTFFSFFDVNSFVNEAEGSYRYNGLKPVKLSRFQLKAIASNIVDGIITVTVKKNGAPTAIVFAIPVDGTVLQDNTVTTVTLNTNDEISIAIETTAVTATIQIISFTAHAEEQ